MTENRTEYSEEFFFEDNFYVLYVTHISEEVNHNVDHGRDEVYDEVTARTDDTYAIYYRISNIQIDEGNDGIRDIEYGENLVNVLFKKIANDYMSTKYELYEDTLNENTNSFEVHPEHKNTEYIVTFERHSND
jgi:hypothetical protein